MIAPITVRVISGQVDRDIVPDVASLEIVNALFLLGCAQSK